MGRQVFDAVKKAKRGIEKSMEDHANKVKAMGTVPTD